MAEDTMRIKEFIRSYGLLIFSTFLIIPILGLPHFTIVSSIAQAIVLLLWTYFGHVLAHYVSQNKYVHYLNPHMFIHHTNEFNVPRWVNLLQETILNMSSFLIILLIQYLLGVHVFSTSIVVAVALLYVIIHIGDYSLNHNDGHKLHHEFHLCNYAPDFMDVLFNTRCEGPDAPYYNQNGEMLHGIIAVLSTFLLKGYFNWD